MNIERINIFCGNVVKKRTAEGACAYFWHQKDKSGWTDFEFLSFFATDSFSALRTEPFHPSENHMDGQVSSCPKFVSCRRLPHWNQTVQPFHFPSCFIYLHEYR